MAEYRSIHTKMWREDDWFQSLEPDARLFWVYLLTNPSASVAGIYRLTERTMVFESGLTLERVRELRHEFTVADKAYFEGDVIWVRKMREYQSAENPNRNVITRMNKDVAAIPPCELKTRYLIAYGYPINRLSIPPLNNTDTDTHTDTETETDTETDTKQIPMSPAWAAFTAARGLNLSRKDNEQIQDLEDLYGSEAVAQAIDYCNAHKKQNFLTLGYIIKMLNVWQGEGTLGLHPPVNGNGHPGGTAPPGKPPPKYTYVDDVDPAGKPIKRRVEVAA